MLAVSFLFVLSLSAVEVEIDGINYEVLTKIKEAKVIEKSSGYYSGAVVIPESVEYEGVAYAVTSIGYEAFRNCYYLTSVTIPNSVTSIGGWAFEDCYGLTSVTIGNSVTSIGGWAFDGCSGLKEVHISDIAAWCNIEFDYMSNPNPLEYAHHLYLNGKEVTDLIIPEGVTAIKNYAFYGCSGLTSVTIPNSVTSIGEDAFSGCSDLTSSAIPNSVTRIEAYTFYGCSSLTSVTIPNSVKYIGWCAFSGCSDLTSVTIPNSVTSIDEDAFAKCPELTDVYCYAEKVPSTDSEAFKDSYVEYATLHVPTAAMEDYKANAPWSSFGTIVNLSGDMPVEPEIEKCETPSVVYKDGKLTLTSGTDGAEFITKVVADDAKTFYDSEIEFSASYNIEVFAQKNSCENSDTVNVTLCWIDQDGADEENDIINVPSVPVLVQSNGGTLTLDGVPAGTDITVYTTSGTEIAKTIATGATTSISVGLSNGTIVIVKIGNRSVKVRLR